MKLEDDTDAILAKRFTADEFMAAIPPSEPGSILHAALTIAAAVASVHRGPRPQQRDGESILVDDNPYYNLDGALYDLTRQGADPVCLRTIQRVRDQIGIISKAYGST